MSKKRQKKKTGAKKKARSTFAGPPKKVVRKFYLKSNGRGKKRTKIRYFVDIKTGKRASQTAWRQSKTYEKEKPRPVKQPTTQPKGPSEKIVLLPEGMHHKSLLSYLKTKMFEQGYTAKILKGGKLIAETGAAGSANLFLSLKKMYSDFIQPQKTPAGQFVQNSDDLIYNIAEDIENKVLYIDLDEIFFQATDSTPEDETGENLENYF